MSYIITLIKGDGIGPEVINSTIEVIKAAGVRLTIEEQFLGMEAIKQSGEVLPPSCLESIRRNRVALKGPTTTPISSGHRSANVALRKALDLYACIRPVKSIPGLQTRFSDVDLVVVRENTEGLYGGQELEIQPGCVVSLRTITQKNSQRIAKAAFEFAKKNNRQKICVAHKANILKMGDGLFLSSIRSIRESYIDIQYEEAIIDALCMRLVEDPRAFDILLLENMFGDIVSDLCAGLVGGLGVVPGANMGDECAVFEAVHGSAPDIAGRDLANPTAMIQSAIMMLRHLGEAQAAAGIEGALFFTLGKKEQRTRDLGGLAGTSAFAKSIISQL